VHSLGNGLKRLVMAGQVGIKPDGTLPPDLGGQIEQAYDNLLAVLASEGMSAADLVKITYFTTDKSPEGLKLSREIRVIEQPVVLKADNCRVDVLSRLAFFDEQTP